MMGTFSSYERRKQLHIDNMKLEDAKEAIKHFLNEVSKPDPRRIKWIVERAANTHAEAIERLEKQEVVAAYHKQEERVNELRQRKAQLTEDFIFLSAIEAVLNHHALETFAKEVAASFKKER